MIYITINNNRGELTGKHSRLRFVREKLKIRNPNAWFLRQYMRPGWDGYQQYITEKGSFLVGLLPQVVAILEDKGWAYKILDKRIKLDMDKKLVTKLKGLEARDYQVECISAVLNNKVGNIEWYRGLIKAATNAGKTPLMALLYKCFNTPTIIVINNSELYNQAVKDDFPKLFGDKFGYLQGKNLKKADIMICMAPSLKNRLQEDSSFKKWAMNKFNALYVDECDLADSTTYKAILTSFFGCYIKLGFSGSVLVDERAKYKLKNQNIRGFFGSVIFDIDNRTLVDKGYSSEVRIKILEGNQRVNEDWDYPEEYKHGITLNKTRNDIIENLVKDILKEKKNSILIVCRYHKHVKVLYKRFEDYNLRVDWVHHSRKGRKDIVNRFKKGKVKVLISSLIVKRGLNFPLLNVIINASGGDSPENAIQLLGRATRKHASKEYTELYDFMDQGRYLKRHSKHRINYYKSQKFKVAIL